MDPTEKIELGVLRAEKRMLDQHLKRVEDDNNNLRRKVEELQNERVDLIRQNAVNKEKNELEIERAKLEADRERKGGLEGIMGDLKDPEMLKFLAGFLKPDHPMFQNAAPVNGLPAAATRFHENDDVNMILTDLPNTIKEMDPVLISKVYMIFQKFNETPALIEQVFSQLNIA